MSPLRPSRVVRGFTIIELMVVLVVTAIVLAVGLPTYSNAKLSSKLRNYSTKMVSVVYLARAEAIKRNQSVVLCASADSATCATGGDWEQGWILLDPNDIVIRGQQSLAAGYKLAGTVLGTSTQVRSINFAPSGLVSPSVNFLLCRKTPTVGYREREMRVFATGRTKVDTTSNTVCP